MPRTRCLASWDSARFVPKRGREIRAANRNGRGTLAAGDLCSLEGRAGRRRGGDDPFPVAENDLGVGADVDEQRHLLVEVGPLRENHARGIRADMPGDTGQHIGIGAGIKPNVELACWPRDREPRSEREGR